MNKSIHSLLLLAFLILLASCRSSYKVVNAQKNSSTVTLSLAYTGSDDYYVKEKSPIIKQLKFIFHVYAFQDFEFKITDSKSTRFEVPQEGVFPIDPLRNFSFPISLSAVRLEYTESPFDFRITRKINNATLFSTYDSDFVYSDKYLEIGTQIDSDYTWGWGERMTNTFRLGNGKWTIFNRDRWHAIDSGNGSQTYGYYPFYLQRESEKFYHVNYFRTSNAIDAIRQTKNGKHYMTFKTIGGIMDCRFFLAEQSPEGALQKFHLYIGPSAIPPFWSMGFHQSRWGYRNITYLLSVLKSYKDNDLPLDTIYSDIDYMIDYEDFTIDENRFPLEGLKEIMKDYHYVPIIDAGVKVTDGTAYNEGKKRGVFIKDANGQEQQKSIVWPGDAVFVDFFNPNANKYWQDMLNILYSKVQFSGIWLDMNEYATFCEGPCETPTGPSKFDYSNDLPYVPGSDSIENHTIPLNSTHYKNISEADVHAFAAFLQMHSTNEFLRSKGKRPFILTRSSTLGSHKYGFHETGDNEASFQFLRGTITDIFNNQMWGFQMVGAVICGFRLNTTEQLCSRWFQLGSLYPFARDHNDNQTISQEPYALGDKVLKAAQNGLKLRYSLLKHYYSLIVSRKGFGYIFKPLFFDFPLDNNNYIDDVVNTQFLLGNELMAAPILEEGQTSRNVYFSTLSWFNFYDGTMYKPGTARIENVQITDRIPLFIREGEMVLTQNTDRVSSSKDLDNVFHMVMGCHFENTLSNATHKIYVAGGSHLSIRDYNDETKLEFCILEGCQYTFGLRLEVTQNTRTLRIDTSYAGGILLDELIVISGVSVYYDGTAVTNQFVNPVQIKGPGEIVVPINDPASKNIATQ